MPTTQAQLTLDAELRYAGPVCSELQVQFVVAEARPTGRSRASRASNKILNNSVVFAAHVVFLLFCFFRSVLFNKRCHCFPNTTLPRPVVVQLRCAQVLRQFITLCAEPSKFVKERQVQHAGQ